MGEEDAVAGALLGLINGDELHRRMGRASLADSARFDPAQIGARYESMLRGLVSKGSRGLHRTRASLLSGAYAVKDALAGAVPGALQSGRTA